MTNKNVLCVLFPGGRVAGICTNKKLALKLINDFLKERERPLASLQYSKFVIKMRKNGWADVETELGTFTVMKHRLNELYRIWGISKF